MSELDWLDDDEERGLERLTMTKADKIRSMTDKELADWIAEIIDCWHCPVYDKCCQPKKCNEIIKDWLQQEAESNEL